MIDFFKKKGVVLLLGIVNISFIIYYIILAYYARPHYDDLHFLWMLRDMSIFDYVKEMYFSLSGRFMAYLTNGIVFKLAILLNEYRFFPILFGFIGFMFFWQALKGLSKYTSKFLLLNIILLFYNLYILTSIDFPVFYWLCAMSYYILAPMLLYLIVIINKNSISALQWGILIFLVIFLGGGHEAFTPIVLAVLFCNFCYYFYKNNYNFIATWKDRRVRLIFIVSLIIVLCFIIVVIAPGNYNRLKDTSEFKHSENLFDIIKGFVSAIITFWYFVSFYIPYYGILILLFVYIGKLLKEKTRIIFGLSYKQLAVLCLLAYIIYLCLTVTPSVFLWGGFGIQRNYTHAVFFTMAFLCFQGFIFGYFKSKNNRVKHIILGFSVGLLILTAIMTVNIKADTISARKYAQSIDDRLQYLTTLNNQEQKDTVSVARIKTPYTKDVKWVINRLIKAKNNPQPMLYYISDTEVVPNEYALHYSKVYNLNFLIKLEQ